MNKVWAAAGALLIITPLLAVGGCASGGKREAMRERGGPGAGINQSRILLSRARELQAEQGCAKAVPTYRVAASFGEGYEPAQYELGACLLEIDGVRDNETALFREEGLLWIKRAAWAGNARAQHRLAHLLSGAGYDPAGDIAVNTQQAMGWALVYNQNPTRELYALRDVAAPVMAHLQASLSEEERAAAAAFAAEFDEIKLASFTPPAQSRGATNARRRSSPEGRRPDRRQADKTVLSQAD